MNISIHCFLAFGFFQAFGSAYYFQLCRMHLLPYCKLLSHPPIKVEISNMIFLGLWILLIETPLPLFSCAPTPLFNCSLLLLLSLFSCVFSHCSLVSPTPLFNCSLLLLLSLFYLTCTYLLSVTQTIELYQLFVNVISLFVCLLHRP